MFVEFFPGGSMKRGTVNKAVLLVIVGCGLLCANRGGRLRWGARFALLLFGACLLAFLGDLCLMFAV